MIIVTIITVIILIIANASDFSYERRVSSQTDAIITNIMSRKNNRNDTVYDINYEFEFNNIKYSKKQSTTKDFSNLSIGSSIKVLYNQENPDECTIQGEKNIRPFTGAIIFIGVFVLVWELGVFEKRAYERLDKRKDISFSEKLNIEKKGIILITVPSTIIMIILMCFVWSKQNEYFIPMTTKVSALFFVGAIISVSFWYFFKVIAIFKLEKDKNIIKQINEKKYSNKMKTHLADIFLLSDCIIEISSTYKKIYYSEILLVDQIVYSGRKTTSYILIINKKMKRIKIAIGSYYFPGAELSQNVIIEEVKNKVPNVIIGYNKKNLALIRNMSKTV